MRLWSLQVTSGQGECTAVDCLQDINSAAVMGLRLQCGTVRGWCYA